jgi:hypothetical protein
VNNWKKLTNSRNRVRKKSFGGTFCFSNYLIIRLVTGGLVFLVSGRGLGTGRARRGYAELKIPPKFATTTTTTKSFIEPRNLRSHG